ncbi:MAG: hypothetical protein LBR65_03960 [Culturomica sp.]|jgi:hypothetical protein|nr:hypothetical protein [Culturomica sp.]
MTLIPESIEAYNTRALDITFKNRLINTGPQGLRIDLEKETDLVKLGLWLEQFGIPSELLPDDLSEFGFRVLLQKVMRIYRLSGTPLSIVLLAEALQASGAKVGRSCYVVSYDGGIRHNSAFRYDAGQEFKSFAVDVHVDGISEAGKAEFETRFRSLFRVFQPVGLFLREVNFSGVFDVTFDSTFN